MPFGVGEIVERRADVLEADIAGDHRADIDPVPFAWPQSKMKGRPDYLAHAILLLGVALFAIAKAMLVFGGALVLAWVAAIVMRLAPFGSRLIGAERLVWAPASSSPGTLTGKWTGGLAGNRAARLAGGLAREPQFDANRTRFPPPSLAR